MYQLLSVYVLITVNEKKEQDVQTEEQGFEDVKRTRAEAKKKHHRGVEGKSNTAR